MVFKCRSSTFCFLCSPESWTSCLIPFKGNKDITRKLKSLSTPPAQREREREERFYLIEYFLNAET